MNRRDDSGNSRDSWLDGWCEEREREERKEFRAGNWPYALILGIVIFMVVVLALVAIGGWCSYGDGFMKRACEKGFATVDASSAKAGDAVRMLEQEGFVLSGYSEGVMLFKKATP